VIKLEDGSLVIAGESSPNPYTLDFRICARSFAVRLGAAGNILWSGLVGADYTSAAYAIIAGHDGYPVLAGYQRREDQELTSLSIYLLKIAAE